MPKTKRSKKSKALRVKLPPTAPEGVMPSFQNAPKTKSWKVPVFLVVLLVLLVAARKGWIVSAVVNGRPIFSWQLNNVLVSRFGKQTLEGMVGETLIVQEARKAGVRVIQADIDAKASEFTQSLGSGVNLDDLLRLQGMTKEDFENQILVQLTIEKLLSRDLVITESDIDTFIATNRARLTATTEAALRDEARQTITADFVGEKIQTWFTELKAKAKILRLL